MAWQDEQPPWGKGGRSPSPEDFIADLLKKLKQTFGGGNGAPPGDEGDQPPAGRPPQGLFGGIGKLLFIILIIVLIQIVYSSFYTIKPGERGVVLRFGEYSRTASPGLNFKIPLVDNVIKVDIETVRKEEFGFRTKVPGQKSIYQREGFDAESLMLTADKNVIDVQWIVQYKVQDPFNFLFKVQDVQQAVRDVSETAIRRIVGNMDFDYVLSNREILASRTADELQTELNNYEAGVVIVTVQLQDVNPPDAVKPAFNEVNEADQDMKRLVNEAEEAYNRVIPKARGEALQIVEEASGYAAQRVNQSKGDTARFLSIMKEYQA
ncbi:MAG: FtsH protease activity modulator HflK, partial [Desulfobulbales bacterium]|nr:FtsH protease activity modulator HflK [Desulfobulbales bacterium]